MGLLHPQADRQGPVPGERPPATGTTSRRRSSLRVPTDGSGEPRGSSTAGSRTAGSLWFFWMRQPVLSPGRPHDRGRVGRHRPARERRRHAVLRHRDEEVHEARSSPSPRRSATRTRRGCRTGATSLLVKNGRDGSRGAPRSSATTRRTSGLHVTGPGYISPAPSPDSKYIAATQDRQLRHRRRHPRRDDGRRAAPRHRRRRLVLAGLVAGRRRDRLPPPRRRDRGSRDGRARWRGRQLDGRRDDVADGGLGARRGVAARLVHPAGRDAGPGAARASAAPASSAPGVTRAVSAATRP